MAVVDPVDVLIKVVNAFFEDRQLPNAVVRAAVTGPYLIRLSPSTKKLLETEGNLAKLNEMLAEYDFGQIQFANDNHIVVALGGHKRG